MRRIRISEARSGMVLGGNVHDAAGVLLLAAGDELTDADIERLIAHHVSHVVIDEPPPPVAGPAFPADLAARTMQELNTLIVMHQATTKLVEPAGVAPIDSLMNQLAECAMAAESSEDDFAGADSIHGQLYVHPIKVAELAMCIAAKSGRKRFDVHAAGMAAALMNLGYLELRRSGIDEPRPLDEDEWEQQVRRHPEHSVAMLRSSGVAQVTLDTIMQHHERWDGSGYPAGLAGDATAPLARILAIADTYVSLRSDRPHRPAFGPREARQFIIAATGSLFDPVLVVAFERAVPRVRPHVAQQHEPTAPVAPAPRPDGRLERTARQPAQAPPPVTPAGVTASAEPEAATFAPGVRPAPEPEPPGSPPPSATPPIARPPGARTRVAPARAAARQPRRRRRRRRTLWSAETYLEMRSAAGSSPPPRPC